LKASLSDVSGKLINDYTGEYRTEFISLLPSDATFSDDAQVAKTTMTYRKDVFELESGPVHIHNTNTPNNTLSDLDSLYVTQSDGQSPLAARIADGVGVEFVTDGTANTNGTANYYSFDSTNSASLLATGTWREEEINTERILRFSVPQSVSSNYDLDTYEDENLLISAYTNELRLGVSISQGTTDTNRDIVTNQVAFKDLRAALSQPLPPLSRCKIGGGLDKTMADFNQAISDCGGQVDLTRDMLVGKNFHRVTSKGESRDYSFNNNGTVDHYRVENGAKSIKYSENWELLNGQVHIFSQSPDEESHWYWALTDFSGNQWAITSYQTFVDSTENIKEIWSFVATEQPL
jgi:hypothetical protein